MNHTFEKTVAQNSCVPIDSWIKDRKQEYFNSAVVKSLRAGRKLKFKTVPP